jgi:UDP-N-acetylmuramate--alanine ligase
MHSFEEAARQAAELAEPGDMVLTLGAGSVSQLGPMVLQQLEKKSPVISTQQSA